MARAVFCRIRVRGVSLRDCRESLVVKLDHARKIRTYLAGRVARFRDARLKRERSHDTPAKDKVEELRLRGLVASWRCVSDTYPWDVVRKKRLQLPVEIASGTCTPYL